MANNFTPSAMEAMRALYGKVFKSSATVNPELNNVPVTQKALLENQTVSVTPLRDALNNCVALRVLNNVGDVTTVSSGSSTPIASTCSLTTGDGMSTVATDFQLNYFQKRSIKLNDATCGNYVDFLNRASFLTFQTLSLMAQGMNNDLIADIEANKSTATAIAGIPDLTIPVADYVLTGAQYWSSIQAADTIRIFDLIAIEKGLPSNYYIVVGKALYVSKAQAQDHAANTNERSYFTTFERQKIYQDVRNLDTIAGADSIFLVDPNCFLGYFNSSYPNVPTPIGDEYNTQIYSIPFEYYDAYQEGNQNVAQVSFMNAGQVVGARIDVRYQKKCNTVGNLGKTSLDHTWEFDLGACFGFVPRASMNNTGIVKIFKAV